MQQTINGQTDIPAGVHRDRYTILAIIMLGSFMAILDGTMVNVALPTITTHYDVSVAQSQWVITGYLLAMTGLFIFFGKISEFTGKARLYLAGFALFTIASLACGLAQSIDQLIAFRVVQGIGASMVAAIGGALIYLAFPLQERGRAMGLFGLTVGVGALIGPALGGFIVDSLDWQYIFLVNVPIGAILLLLSGKYLNVHEVLSKDYRMDWIGAGTLFMSVVSLMLFCGELAKSLEIGTMTIAYGAIFTLSLIAFVTNESLCKKPLLDLSIFGNRRFMLPVMSSMLYNVPLSIVGILGPFYFQGVMMYSPSQVGLLFALPPLVLMFAAPAAGVLYDRYQWKYTSAAGMLIASAGFLVLGYAFLAESLTLIVVAFVFRGIGGGAFMGPNSIETIGALPGEKTAIATSVSSTANFLSAMLGVALSTVLLTGALSVAGFNGPAIAAGPTLLSSSIGSIMILAALLTVMAVITSALPKMGRTPTSPAKGMSTETKLMDPGGRHNN